MTEGRDIWFISDTHFGHSGIIRHAGRPYETVDEMDTDLVKRWNAKVGRHDLVYHLGDFAWSAGIAKRIRPRLNGAIRLIAGNHDDIPPLVHASLFQRVYLWKQFREHGFTASHIPLRREQLRHGRFCVHGHVHGIVTGDPHYLDVSVESIGYEPIHMKQVLEWKAGTKTSAFEEEPL